MSDLVTRLLALADKSNPFQENSWGEDFWNTDVEPRNKALREAAAEIKRLQRDLKGTENARDQYTDWNSEARAEVRALKAKLAEAETNNATLGAACNNLKAAQKLVEHNFKAVAKERDEARAEAAALRDAAASYIEPWEPGVDDVGSGASKAIAWRRLNAALSQPGPGAAYQAYVRKLEAVAEAGSKVDLTGGGVIALMDALAALEEKP